MGNPAAGGDSLAVYACDPGAASSFKAVIFAALHMQRYLGNKAYDLFLLIDKYQEHLSKFTPPAFPALQSHSRLMQQ